MTEKDINIEDEELQEDAQDAATVNETETTADETENTADNPAEGKDAEAEEAMEKDPLEAAQEEIESLKDKYLRSVAEFDNYRKRTLKEKADLILNGGEKTVSAILPVIDDMERAIENGKKTDDVAVLREGMELIYHKFMKTLEGLGVKKIETENADFSTDVHEAVAMVPGMGDDKKGKVIDCLQTGYLLNDKVIRHAKVAVGQ
jgi:molecular chaperone GrpE